MKNESNTRALLTLLTLVVTVVILFVVERKLLINENRGSTLSLYERVRGFDDIMLLIEDFEGLENTNFPQFRDSIFKENAFYSFGSIKMAIDNVLADGDPMASKSVLKVMWDGAFNYGGWGKGVGANIKLDPTTDFLNFRVYFPESHLKKEKVKIILAEDDNEDAILEADQDDEWMCHVDVFEQNNWQLISVPLDKFKDSNAAGDGELNVTRRGGLHTITFILDQPEKYKPGQYWYFDFINISSDVLVSNARFTN